MHLEGGESNAMSRSQLNLCRRDTLKSQLCVSEENLGGRQGCKKGESQNHAKDCSRAAAKGAPRKVRHVSICRFLSPRPRFLILSLALKWPAKARTRQCHTNHN